MLGGNFAHELRNRETGEERAEEVQVIKHLVCKIIGWAEPNSGPGACDGPYEFCPVRRLFEDWENIFGAEA